MKLLCGELSEPDADISFISSERPSCDQMSAAGDMYYDMSGVDLTPRMSTASDRSFQSQFFGTTEPDMGSMFSSSSIDCKGSCSTRPPGVIQKIFILRHKVGF